MTEDKTPFLKKERAGFFILGIGKLDRWQKARPDPEFPYYLFLQTKLRTILDVTINIGY